MFGNYDVNEESVNFMGLMPKDMVKRINIVSLLRANPKRPLSSVADTSGPQSSDRRSTTRRAALQISPVGMPRSSMLSPGNATSRVHINACTRRESVWTSV